MKDSGSTVVSADEVVEEAIKSLSIFPWKERHLQEALKSSLTNSKSSDPVAHLYEELRELSGAMVVVELEKVNIIGLLDYDFEMEGFYSILLVRPKKPYQA